MRPISLLSLCYLFACHTPSAVGPSPTAVRPSSTATTTAPALSREDLCRAQVAALRAALRTGQRLDVLVEAARLEATPSCRQARPLLRETARVWHREATTTRVRAGLEAAAELHRICLILDPADRGSRFAYGELLFTLERWGEAAEQYHRVAQEDPQGPKAVEAAYAAVVAWRNRLNVIGEAREVRPETRGKPGFALRPITPETKKTLAFYRLYLRIAGVATKEVVPVLYRMAQVYYELNHFAEAVPLFARIATRHPGHELAVYAANLLLDSLNIRKRYQELEQWVDRFLATPKLCTGEFGMQLHRLKMGIGRKAAENLIRGNQPRKAAELYLQLAGAYPKDPRLPELLYNAAIAFEKANDLPRATATLRRLVRVQSKSTLVVRALWMLGKNHETLGQKRKAVQAYEQLVRRFPGERESPEALARAVSLRMDLGQRGMALANYRQMCRLYRRSRRHAQLLRKVYEEVAHLPSARSPDRQRGLMP